MKAQIRIFTLFIISIIVISFILQEGENENYNYHFNSEENLILSSKKMDGNNISTWYRNNGSFNRDPITGNAGFQWPKGAGPAYTIRYASGMWIGAKIEDSIHIAVAEFTYEYLPGYVDDNGNPQGKDDPDYRVYVINKGDTTSDDYLNWPVDQGAYLNQNSKPYLSGNQSMWLVYTDGYPESHINLAGYTAPLKAQILNYNWSYNQNNFLKDVIFSEYRIINRSNKVWDSTFFSFWSDDDVGTASNCAAGCDTTMDLGFVYKFTPTDPVYGDTPPAVSYLLLKGPSVYTGNTSDTLTYYQPPGSQNKIQKIGYKNIGMISFNVYYNGDPNMGDPRNYRETWNSLRGLIPQSGNPHINPLTGNSTPYIYSGDPESQTGWLQSHGNNLRQMVTVGPITMQPGDTQTLVIAQIVAQGVNHRNSVTLLKEYAQTTKQIYDENFANVVSVSDLNQNIPERFYLYQNYPNPFNPETKIRFDIKQTSNVVLKVYDVSGKLISTLVDNERLTPGAKQITFNAAGLSSGVYFYTLEADNFKVTKKMILVR
jgi:hypothetical protein